MRYGENGFLGKTIYQDVDGESKKMKKNWRENEYEEEEGKKEREESFFTLPSGLISVLFPTCQKIQRTADEMNSLNLCVCESG